MTEGNSERLNERKAWQHPLQPPARCWWSNFSESLCHQNNISWWTVVFCLMCKAGQWHTL